MRAVPGECGRVQPLRAASYSRTDRAEPDDERVGCIRPARLYLVVKNHMHDELRLLAMEIRTTMSQGGQVERWPAIIQRRGEHYVVRDTTTEREDTLTDLDAAIRRFFAILRTRM